MRSGPLRISILLFLAGVFTAGLTFATVELPYRLDELLQNAVTTPGGDSHADAVSRLKTELFMAHYHVRAAGYVAFFTLLALIVAGFATRRSGLAVVGAFGVMLAAFAQFASVMFFLAGLGLLNALWLPVLDLSWEVQSWGRVIDVPNDALRWLLGLIGVTSPWPTTILFIGAGILVFLVGTYAWLAARARGDGVAEGWVYRISRHPQYLGWILWTYGAYLLIQQARYPKRSWGIGASLPWLLSTLVIVGVAMVEELNMRERWGEAYERYRRRAPFLVPLPRLVERALAAPGRWLIGKEWPERRLEVVAVLGTYGAALVAVSALFFGGGLHATVSHLSSQEARTDRMSALVTRASIEPDRRRRYRHLLDLTAFGDPAVDPLLGLVRAGSPELKVLAAEVLEGLPADRSVPVLGAALLDPDENLRYRAMRALGAIGSPEVDRYLLPLLDDPAEHIRVEAFEILATLEAEEILGRAPLLVGASGPWMRARALRALGAFGSERAIPYLAMGLEDESPDVRREAVVALLRVGSPLGRPYLESAADDADYEVRIYAEEALKRLPSR